MQAEQVPLPAKAVPDIIRDETKCLRCHLGLEEAPEMSPRTPSACAPMFFIERAPNSRNGAKCQLPYCPHPRVVQLLLEHGASMLELDRYWASVGGHENVAEELLMQEQVRRLWMKRCKRCYTWRWRAGLRKW